MNKMSCLVPMLLVAFNANAVSIEGTWQEDKEKTLEWNSAYLKTDPAYLEKLDSIVGHMYITYKGGEMCQYFEPYTVNVKGIAKNVSRLSTVMAKYKIIAANSSGVVLQTMFNKTDEHIEMIIFESKDSVYAVQLSTEDYGHPGARVYFKRIAPVKWGFDCKY